MPKFGEDIWWGNPPEDRWCPEDCENCGFWDCNNRIKKEEEEEEWKHSMK